MMNPRQVEAFRAVVQLGSMTNAAELLNISQPAVSRLIRDFEAHLELRLFRREGNRLVPEREALVLFQEVDLHYRGMAQIESVARDLRGHSAGTLTIAASHSLSTFFIPDITTEFLAERPNVKVSIASPASPDIIERVALQQFELGLVQIAGDYTGVRVLPLAIPAAVCILPFGHPLAAHEVLTPQLIAKENFISLGRNSPVRARADALFASLGIERPLGMEAALASTVRALVARGLGIAIVDPFAAAVMGDADVVVRAFSPVIPFDVAVVVPAHRSLSSNAQRFLDLIRIRFREKAAQFR